RRVKARSSSGVWKRAASPECRCTTRPASPAPWPPTRGWNCTTKTWSLRNTRWVGAGAVGSLVFVTGLSLFTGALVPGPAGATDAVGWERGRNGGDYGGKRCGAVGLWCGLAREPHEAGASPGVEPFLLDPTRRSERAAEAGRRAGQGAARGEGRVAPHDLSQT